MGYLALNSAAAKEKRKYKLLCTFTIYEDIELVPWEEETFFQLWSH